MSEEFKNSQKESNERKIYNDVIKISPTDYSCYTDVKPETFSFRGEEYPAHEWKSLLLSLCCLVAKENLPDFDRVIEGIVGKARGRKYFSKEEAKLQKACKVVGPNIYVETNLSANETASLCDAIYEYFGYGHHFVLRNVK